LTSQIDHLNITTATYTMAVLAGFMDYRKNPITVTQIENNTYTVEVIFTMDLLTDITGVDMDIEALASDWCTMHHAVDPFEGFFPIRQANWHGNTLIMTVKNKNQNAEEIHDELKFLSLEDTGYEGDITGNFWLVPLSFIRDWQEDE
jgi:hypothetical protein